MSYKTILVHLDTSQRVHIRFECALKLAVAYQAHLIGVFAVCAPSPVSLLASGGATDWYIQHQQRRLEKWGALERLFHAESKRAGISSEWRMVDGDANREVPRAARCADLAIVGQIDPEDSESYIAHHFQVHLALTSGCLVLFLPHVGQLPCIGTHVLLAWDGSREATRALHDALPFLKSAKQVTVLTINCREEAEVDKRTPGLDISRLLARHQVKATLVQVDGVAHQEIGNTLLSCATDLSVDLIVMGAYGHTRQMELIQGGATFSALRSMKIPILFSH